jgi:hypothetical protein
VALVQVVPEVLVKEQSKPYDTTGDEQDAAAQRQLVNRDPMIVLQSTCKAVILLKFWYARAQSLK